MQNLESLAQKNNFYFFTLMAQFIWTSIQNLKPLAQQMAEIFHQKWMKILLYLTYYTVMLLKVQSLDNNISTTDYTVQTPLV